MGIAEAPSIGRMRESPASDRVDSDAEATATIAPNADAPGHRQCGSYASATPEISSSSSKFGWGGARHNSGGARENSGGVRENSGGVRENAGGARPNSGGARKGSGRKPKATMADARVTASLQSIAAPPPAGARWYCVATFNRQELPALGELTKQGFAAWLPRYERPTPGEPQRILALFPGYLFVRLDLGRDAWWRVNNTPGVRKLFPIERERPWPLPVGVVERWIAKQGDDGLMPRALLETPKVRLAAGEQVTVTDGPFAGLSGVLQASGEARVRVLLTLFGRSTTEVTLPSGAVAGRATPPDGRVLPEGASTAGQPPSR